MSDSATPWTAARQASWSIIMSQSPPKPCSLSQWCHPTISSAVVPFSSCLQSFPTSRSFQMSQLFASGGQGIGVSASTSVLPMNTQDWSPLGWTGWISLQSKGLSRAYSNITVQNINSLAIDCYFTYFFPAFFCITEQLLESNKFLAYSTLKTFSNFSSTLFLWFFITIFPPDVQILSILKLKTWLLFSSFPHTHPKWHMDDFGSHLFLFDSSI